MPMWILLVLLGVTTYFGIGAGVGLATLNWFDNDVDNALFCVSTWPLVLLVIIVALPVTGLRALFEKVKEQMEKERNQK